MWGWNMLWTTFIGERLDEIGLPNMRWKGDLEASGKQDKVERKRPSGQTIPNANGE